jgi:hypothetical protein
MKNDKIQWLLREPQGGRCAVTGHLLPEDTACSTPNEFFRNLGGEYKLDNLRAVLPAARQSQQEEIRASTAALESELQ